MEDIHPPKPVIDTPIFSETEVLIFWGLIALILGIIFVYQGLRWHQRLQERKSLRPPPPKDLEDYRREAIERLRALKPLITNGKLQIYYLEVTDIIKWFLSHKYHIPLSEHTSQEIFTKRKFPAFEHVLLQQFLKQVDRAKFAREHQAEFYAEEVYALAKKICLHETSEK